jgi:hypothetical protein
MSRTKNKFKPSAEGSNLFRDYKKRGLNRKLRQATGTNSGIRIVICDPYTPWKYGKPERGFQSDRNKGRRKVYGKKFRRYLERDAAREIMEELEE